MRRLIAESGAPAAVTLLPQAAAGAVAQRDRMDGLAHDLIGQLFGEEAAGGRKDLIVYAVAPPEEGGREVAYVRDAHEKLPRRKKGGGDAFRLLDICQVRPLAQMQKAVAEQATARGSLATGGTSGVSTDSTADALPRMGDVAVGMVTRGSHGKAPMQWPPGSVYVGRSAGPAQAGTRGSSARSSETLCATPATSSLLHRRRPSRW